MQSKAVTQKKTKTSLTDKAYTELKKLILDNKITAGDQLLEAELAALLKMSRTPTREAMMRLDAEGLVEVRPRHGMKVKPVSIKDMKEIYMLLIGLESTAAWQAAQNEQSEKEIRTLGNCVTQMDEALEKEDLVAWAHADEAFHKQLVHMSGNERLIELVDRFFDQSHRVRMLTLKMRPLPVKSNADHREVLSAIVDGDADKARRLHRIHREKSGQMMIELLENLGLTQL
ncbi:GntR family transcriptional regulator [Curvivirga sp.]|uniref:GntR family transcriptional regulator n=1 Tax=Curvivirga sp. TaxID=2856848 RepID=UPI003B5B617D